MFYYWFKISPLFSGLKSVACINKSVESMSIKNVSVDKMLQHLSFPLTKSVVFNELVTIQFLYSAVTPISNFDQNHTSRLGCTTH